MLSGASLGRNASETKKMIQNFVFARIHLTPDSPKYIDQVVVDRDLLYLSNATGIIQRSCHIIENELLKVIKVKVHVEFAGTRNLRNIGDYDV